MNDIKVDVLIIGAGPSGCVAGGYLQKMGCSLKIVEKSKFPRFVVGESLLPRCMDHFEEAGFMDVLHAQNYEIKAGARFLKNDLICNFDFSDKHTDGWDYTWQVPRADFDNTLAQELIRKGVDVTFEEEVIAVNFEEKGHSTTTIKKLNGEIYHIKSKFIIDSSGFGRVLPRFLDLEKPSLQPKHSSIFTHIKDTKRPTDIEGTLITFEMINEETWLWVIPFSNGNTSVGFVGPTDFIESFEGTNSDKLLQLIETSTHYSERLADEKFLFEPHLIKNYSKSVKKLFGEGFALTGNSAEFLDPVFSSGVTFATESGILAAKLAFRQLNGEQVNWQVEYADYILRGVNVFATYVNEWYTGNLQKIFFHSAINPSIKKQICGVLTGYVWDETNPFVKKHDRLVKTVAHIVDLEKEQLVS